MVKVTGDSWPEQGQGQTTQRENKKTSHLITVFLFITEPSVFAIDQSSWC
jgi:hypothetical protein